MNTTERCVARGLTTPLASHAAARPDAPALVFPDETLTWAALHAAVEARAREIAALPPGGVALRLSNSAALIVLVLASARAGREAQVLDSAWPDDTARAVRARLAPAALVTECEGDVATGEGHATLAPCDAASSPEYRGGCGPHSVAAHLVPRPLRLADLPPLAPPLATVREEPLPQPDPASPFYVGFTSGSTGLPKGYRRSQRSWVASFAAERAEFGIGPADTVAAPGHFTHSLFLYAVLAGLHAGARVLALPRFRPDHALRLLAEERATVLWGVPTHYGLILERAEREGVRLPALRLALASGAKWPAALMPRLAAVAPDALFAEFYGASELSFVALARADEEVPKGSVGRPFPGVEVVVRDRAGRRLPTGRRGLVHVASDLVFIDYACGEAEDDACLRRGREVSVGDAGWLDERGFLHLSGRWKRMIVTSGKNVFPEEIERLVERRPDVAASCVLGRPDARRGERLLGIVASEGEGPSRADLVAWCRARLPLALVPHRWHRLDDWPMTGSGKTDFAAVARALAEGRTREIP